LVDPANAWMFEGENTVSVLEGFEIFALVQECQDPYTAKIVETLLLNTEGGNPLTFVAGEFAGWTWEQFVDKLWNTSKKSKLKCLPLALVKGGKVEHCPDFSTVIQADDYLAIIAPNDFPWEKFKKQLLATGQ
jgi:voltage-gated potassium channel